VKGIIPLGTSMDFESRRSRDLGCWDGIEFCTPAIDALAEPVGDDWVIPIELVDAVLKEGLGDDVPPEERAFWHATVVNGGQHFLSASNPDDVNPAAVEFIDRWT